MCVYFLKVSKACIEKPMVSPVDEVFCITLPRSQKEKHMISYIAGYVAKKLQKEFRELGNLTRVATTEPITFVKGRVALAV